LFAALINDDVTGLTDAEERLLLKFEGELIDGITPVMPEDISDNFEWCEVVGYIADCYAVKFVQF
tara:strand:- start:268 stop:462 length:195 start_codon:yes stop_codon:yes gene_type:complete